MKFPAHGPGYTEPRPEHRYDGIEPDVKCPKCQALGPWSKACVDQITGFYCTACTHSWTDRPIPIDHPWSAPNRGRRPTARELDANEELLRAHDLLTALGADTKAGDLGTRLVLFLVHLGDGSKRVTPVEILEAYVESLE